MEKAKILIVEEKSDVALEIQNILRNLGYEVISSVNKSKNAIKKAEIDKPDIILMDFGIKGKMDSIEVADVIRSQYRIPVIFLVANADEEKIEKVKIAKTYRYILKPLRKMELKITIEMALYITKNHKERRRVKKSLKESENKYKTILESIDDGYYEVDTRGNFTFANDATSRIYEVERDEMIGLNFQNYMDEENINKVLSISKGAHNNTKKGKIYNVEILTKEETKKSIEYSVSLLKDTNAAHVGYYGIMRDITKKKETEQALLESEEQYRTLFERSSDAIFILDQFTGKYINANQAAERLTGYSLAEIKTKTTKDLTPIGAERRLKMMPILEARKEIGEVDYLRADGAIRNTILAVVPIRGNQIMGIAHDITNRKKAEVALEMVHTELESKVEQRTAELEEINTALNVLLKRSDKDRTELEEKVLSNVKELIIPIIKKLERSHLDDQQIGLLNTIETNLTKIISPFSRILSSKYSNLTPKEIQVANLIREGNTSKEIAESMASNINTVEFHRGNIRKKLGLRNIKKNLRTLLLSLEN